MAAGENDSRFRVPDKGQPAETVKVFMDAFFDPKSPARREWVSEMYMAKMMIESNQWLEREKNPSPSNLVRWTSQPDESVDEIPKPITNEILPIFDSEMGRMRNRRSKPRVRNRVSGEEDKRMASRKADRILESHLENEVSWPRVRRSAIYRDVAFGTGVLKSYLDQSWMDTVRVGKSGCYRCSDPSCGSLLADNVVKPDQMLQLPPEQAARVQRSQWFDQEAKSMTVGFQAKTCLDCGSAMTPDQTANMDEAQSKDALGNELGMDVPKNTPMIDSPSTFDIYLENEGIGVTPRDMKQVGQQTPRSLDWIAEHYNLTWDQDKQVYFKVFPDGGRKDLVAEDAVVIGEQHPILGETSYGNLGAASTINRNLYRNHARVREFYSKPTLRAPMGRTIHMAGNLLLLDDDLMIKSQTEKGLLIPRVNYSFMRYFEKEGQLQGQGLCVPLFSPQRRINMTWSQIVGTRERCAVYGIMAPRGARLSSGGWMRGFPGNIVYYETDELQPGQKPEPFPAQLMDTAIYEELNQTQSRMQYMIGMQDADQGKAPSNVSAATAIKLLQDASSERRAQRIEELQDAEKECWSHQLLLLREFVREKRPYTFKSDTTGQEEQDFFDGADLAGQTDIMVEEEPSYDDVAYDRENVIQGMQLNVISPSSPFARYAIGKSLGLPADAMEEQNVQVEDAQRKWYAFRDKNVLPSIDPNEDDHPTFWDVYGKEFKGDDGIRFKTECGWDALLKDIAGWEDKWKQAVALEPRILAMKQAIASGQASQSMDPNMEQKLLNQPALPKAREDQVFFVWSQMVTTAQSQRMQQAQMTQTPPPVTYDIQHPFVKFKAVAEAHRLYMESNAVQQAPQAAAPGTQEQAQPGQQAAQPQPEAGVQVQ